MKTKRPTRKPVEQADPSSTEAPAPAQAGTALATKPQLNDDELDLAILRFLRRKPNRTVDLAPLADELGVDPYRLQLAVEELGRRRMVVVPFIEPGTAGGATLTSAGLRWLLRREGGTPSEKPVALKPAQERVRAADEAARLPRSQVYGVSRG